VAEYPPEGYVCRISFTQPETLPPPPLTRVETVEVE
jgi:hypothetical protein